jgi:superfamily I DNA/RNA helicase
MKHGVDELLNTKYTTKKYGQYLPELHRCIIDTQDMSLQDKLDYYIEYRYDLTKRVIKLANKTESSKKELFRDNEYAYEESGMLIDFSKGYQDAESFLTDLTLEAPSIENDEDYFNVSTVHSAKGLEYNTVFVLSCLDGTFPWDFKPKTINSRTIRKKELEIEEERRILYVAITRAKENLYLMLPLTQFYGGYGSSPSISRFLKENNIKNKYTETMRVRY